MYGLSISSRLSLVAPKAKAPKPKVSLIDPPHSPACPAEGQQAAPGIEPKRLRSISATVPSPQKQMVSRSILWYPVVSRQSVLLLPVDFAWGGRLRGPIIQLFAPNAHCNLSALADRCRRNFTATHGRQRHQSTTFELLGRSVWSCAASCCQIYLHHLTTISSYSLAVTHLRSSQMSQGLANLAKPHCPRSVGRVCLDKQRIKPQC